MSLVLYPKSPQSLPKNLTALTSSYQLRAFLAVLAILLFFLLYSALVLALGYLVYYAFTYEMGHVNKLTLIAKVGAIAGSAMLFVFTLKFIFKLKNNKPKNRIKLSKEDYPELWAFIYKICEETKAPKPKWIYADPDVNAYVSYTNMWLSLFLPVKKELTIGLGLVDCVNLSEFKAIMSHEFGHFAQRSMKIGSFIISANTIIHDMIFARDKWDDLLDQWRASDIRLSAAAWVITPIIWIIRQILGLFYQFLNIMYSSLSREMEFNADKVAISTSGSEAIISGLWKLDSGFGHWNSTINNAYLASQKQLYVRNLYTHNAIAIDKHSEQQELAFNTLPEDQRGGKKFFSGSELSKVNMYASHPPNDKRQDNAKVPFIACEEDTRSPWLLFEQKEQLQEAMTALLYEHYLGKTTEETKQKGTPEAFEAFIASEHKDKALLEAYDNTFLNRYLNIPELPVLQSQIANTTLNKETATRLKSELKTLMAPVNAIEALMEKAGQIAEGTTQEVSFAFNGKEFKKKNLQEGMHQLFEAREKLFNESFKDWDAEFCAFHLGLAKANGQEQPLINLYKQHQELSNIYKKSLEVKNTIYKELQELQQRDEVEQYHVSRFGTRVNDLVLSINTYLERLDTLEFAQLPNIDSTAELKSAILPGGCFKKAQGAMFENGEFDRLLQSLETAINHCQRVDQKSIGAILAFHDTLQQTL